jgi:hypothetical protein
MYQKEFFHLLSLPSANDQKIQKFKQACTKHIGNFPSMNARAHISFKKWTDDVDRLSGTPLLLNKFHDIFERVFGNVPPPIIKLKGFGYFEHGPNQRTIYARIVMTEETKYWFDYVKQVFLIKGEFNPHVTIARKISTESFNKLWPYFKDFNFEDSFQIDFLTVLSKEAGKKYLGYQIYKQIPFSTKLRMSGI